MPTRQHAGSGPAPPDVPEPSLAERARTLASLGRIGSLSTHSRKFAGFPFGSMMPYAADELGRTIFFISSMAMHTQNLQQDARARPARVGEGNDDLRVRVCGIAVKANPVVWRRWRLTRPNRMS